VEGGACYSHPSSFEGCTPSQNPAYTNACEYYWNKKWSPIAEGLGSPIEGCASHSSCENDTDDDDWDPEDETEIKYGATKRARAKRAKEREDAQREDVHNICCPRFAWQESFHDGVTSPPCSSRETCFRRLLLFASEERCFCRLAAHANSAHIFFSNSLRFLAPLRSARPAPLAPLRYKIYCDACEAGFESYSISASTEYETIDSAVCQSAMNNKPTFCYKPSSFSVCPYGAVCQYMYRGDFVMKNGGEDSPFGGSCEEYELCNIDSVTLASPTYYVTCKQCLEDQDYIGASFRTTNLGTCSVGSNGGIPTLCARVTGWDTCPDVLAAETATPTAAPSSAPTEFSPTAAPTDAPTSSPTTPPTANPTPTPADPTSNPTPTPIVVDACDACCATGTCR
jgi:hypothetical protein